MTAIEGLAPEIWCRRDSRGIASLVTPINMFRVAASSKSLSLVLGSEECLVYLRATTALQAEEWVYIDDLANTSYNGHFGQIVDIVKKKDAKTKRYAVAVDGMPGDRRFVNVGWSSVGAERVESNKKVSLPAKNLLKVHASVRAVCLHAEGEVPFSWLSRKSDNI